MKQTLRLGIDTDFRPFAYHAAGRAAGLIVEITEKALATMGYRAELVPLALDEVAHAFERGTIDGFAGMAVTEQRQREFSFSEPLLITGGAWFTRASSSGSILASEQIKVAATPAAGPLVAVINTLFPAIVVRETPDYRSALELVIAGAVDAAALNFHVGRMLVAADSPHMFQLPDAPFCSVPLALAVKRDSASSFLSAFNDTLRAMNRLNPTVGD